MAEAPTTIAAAAAALRAGKTSSVALTEAALEKIAKVDTALNAFILVTANAAIEAARKADAEIRSGKLRGPLHGVPYAVKDIIDVAGLPTTAHSKIHPTESAERSADVVERLERAGAILLGKLALHEFAVGGPTFELPYPPARNPWDRERHPGGSSTGAGTAVAAGMAFGAIGTDTGGSIRHPATCCGIVGLKPTYGLVSRSGVFPLAFSLDHVGPLTRTVEDNALMLNVLAGADERDPTSVARTPVDYHAGIDEGVAGLSIGVVAHFAEDGGGSDPEIAAALGEAAELLGAAGGRIGPCRMPPLGEFSACGRTILQAEAYAIHREWIAERPADYSRAALRRILPGAYTSAADYINAQQARRDLCERYGVALEGFDAIIAASSFEFPARLDDPEGIARTYDRNARMPFNVTGAPALAVPVGWSRDGLPIGIQVAGRPFDEATVFRVGHALERAVLGRHGQRPLPDYGARKR